MSRFQVDSEQVASAATAVQGSVQAITSEVDRMMRLLLDLQGSWQGQAASSFQGVVTDWRSTQERVKASLEEINRALSTAGQSYAETEAGAVRMFGR